MRNLALQLCVGGLLMNGMAMAQANNPSSVNNPYYGSATTAPVTAEPVRLSMDEAIRRGLEHNLALILAQDDEKIAKASRLATLQDLLPTVTGSASNGVHEYNLASEGFYGGTLAQFSKVLGPNAAGFQTITKADVTQGQLNYQHTLSFSAFDNYREAKAAQTAAFYGTRSSRGLVVLQVGTLYLQALAASARVDTARELLRADEVLLHQAVEQHQAGVAANLDELRARVQYQSQQQTLIAAENDFDKAKIALNRSIGLAPEQALLLTDTAPYADLAEMTPEQAREQAYQYRNDYQQLKAQYRQAEMAVQSAKHQRLPSLTMAGNYGVTGVSGQVYHGTFVALGTLSVPVFREPQLRGSRQAAEAELTKVDKRLVDMRSQIDQQVRDSLLDVASSAELVRVARSSVELSTRALQDQTDRFAAGIEDNLPLVQAQATLADARSQLIDSLYQYNQSKLQLARNLGIVDTQYDAYLSGGR